VTDTKAWNIAIGIWFAIVVVLWSIIGTVYVCAGWTPLCMRMSLVSAIIGMFGLFMLAARVVDGA
jgi:hypothetical protein